MNTAVLVLLCGLGAVVFILLGALVELFRQVQQIRTHLDLVDRPTPLGLDIAPSAIFIQNGQLQRAHTVPSSRQLLSALPSIRPLNLSRSLIRFPAAL